MGKKKSMFGYIKIEEKENYRNKTPIFLERVGTKKIIVFNKISFGEKKNINTLLVTFIMIIKLSHYI